MQYQKPGFIMNLAAADFDKECNGTKYLLQARAESNHWLLKHKDSTPSSRQLQEATRYVLRMSGLELLDEQLAEILALFPLVRIELAVHDIHMLDVQDNLMDAISNFFLGCTWPRLGDNVDLSKFLTLLRKQAFSMGYKSIGHNEIRKRSPLPSSVA